MLQENTTAPDFNLLDKDNKTHILSACKGSWVLVYFYPKNNTPGCTTEACGFRDSFSDLKDAGVIVFGVSADSVESHKEFASKHRLPFILLSDVEKRVIALYDAKGLFFTKRISYLIDPEGIIRKVYKNVNSSTHANDVLKDVQELRK